VHSTENIALLNFVGGLNLVAFPTETIHCLNQMHFFIKFDTCIFPIYCTFTPPRQRTLHSYLSGSLLSYTRLCNCLVDYDYILRIGNFAILYCSRNAHNSFLFLDQIECILDLLMFPPYEYQGKGFLHKPLAV
jgi:hypothetical protein